MEAISRIRQLLFGDFFSRKRRALDDCETPVNNKVRRFSTSQMSSPEDDWASLSSNNSQTVKRHSGVLPKQIKVKPRISWLKDTNPITVDDEEDDVIEVKKPLEFNFMRKPFRHTSTPKYTKNGKNCEKEVAFLKFLSPNDGRFGPKRRGDNLMSNMYYDDSGLQSTNNKISYYTRPYNYNSSKYTGQQKKMPNSPSAIDCPFRLDDKRNYQKLIDKGAPPDTVNTLLDSFAGYNSPVSKIYPRLTGADVSRGRKLVNLALQSNGKKVCNFIDLTGTTDKETTNDFRNVVVSDKSKPRRSATSEKINKVLNKMDNEVVVKDSSDSDVEILPTPPSPKSDFRVKKCNSLKTYVHPSEPTHPNWWKNQIKKHDEAVGKTAKLIELQSESVARFSSINNELREKILRDRVSLCLHLKGLVVSDETKDISSFPELTPDQEAIISKALDHRQPGGEILCSRFNMNITRQDLLTLSGLNWLNDEVINFYMNLIMDRAHLSHWPNTYAMNTFFYPKIISGGQSSVRRWTRKIDIFTYDIIVVPIHLRMHWCMAIIDFRKKRITYYDSMGSSNTECLDALILYLEDEHLDKKKAVFDTSDWRLTNAKNIPQQMNGSDCGMFACTFAEVLTRDAKINFSQEHMPYLRRKMVLEIMINRLLTC